MKTETKLNAQQVTATSNTTTTFVVDLAGFSRAQIDFFTSPLEDTHAPATMRVGFGTNTSTFTYVDAFSAGTGFTAISNATATTLTNVTRFDIDLRGRERYLAFQRQENASQGVTTCMQTMVCNLFRNARDCSDATGQNVAQLIQG